LIFAKNLAIAGTYVRAYSRERFKAMQRYFQLHKI